MMRYTLLTLPLSASMVSGAQQLQKEVSQEKRMFFLEADGRPMTIWYSCICLLPNENKNHINYTLMKRICLRIVMTLFVAFFAVCPIDAQVEDSTNVEATVESEVHVKYCLSYDDLRADNWIDAGKVKVIRSSRNHQMWWGGKDFKFKSDRSEVVRVLKKEAFALLYNDTLLINTRPYKDRGVKFGNGYAHLRVMKDGRLLMTYFDVHKMQSKAVMGGMFGLIGALAVSSSGSKVANHDVCYLVIPGEKKAKYVDAETMEELLGSDSDLWHRYSEMDKKERVDAGVVIPLLCEAGLL